MTNENLNLLNQAFSSGIINLSDVQQKVDMTKKQRALQKHKYNIWEGKNGYWYTNLPCDNNPTKRRQIKRKTKLKLEEAIISIYFEDDKQDQMK